MFSYGDNQFLVHELTSKNNLEFFLQEYFFLKWHLYSPKVLSWLALVFKETVPCHRAI